MIDEDDKTVCLICRDNIIRDQEYAIINKEGENNYKYHPECLYKWIAQSRKGIVTRQKVYDYDIFFGDKFIENIDVRYCYTEPSKLCIIMQTIVFVCLLLLGIIIALVCIVLLVLVIIL